MLRREVDPTSFPKPRGAGKVCTLTATIRQGQSLSLRSAGMIAAGLLLSLAAGCGGMAAQGLNAEGVRLYDQAQHQEAIQRFERAISSDPDNADAYYNLAAVYHRMGVVNRDPSLVAQAEHYYNQCLDRNEAHYQCYRGLAVLLVEQERSEEAFRLIEGWVDRSPSDAEPKIELARLFEEFGDRQAAKRQLVEALSADPESARALAALGRLREQMGEHALALADYQKSLWYDRYQPQVAARVAALQSAFGPVDTTVPGPPKDTRLVSRNSNPLR
jgi:tetratricopeptide (TPR) repeat protein